LWLTGLVEWVGRWVLYWASCWVKDGVFRGSGGGFEAVGGLSLENGQIRRTTSGEWADVKYLGLLKGCMQVYELVCSPDVESSSQISQVWGVLFELISQCFGALLDSFIEAVSRPTTVLLTDT
jgi:hypothetical protein